MRLEFSLAFAACCLIAATAAGTLQPDTYIIGGKDVDIASHPYLVSIRYRDEAEGAYLHKCAGLIYNERTVITSAQCVRSVADRVMVVAGSNRRVNTDGFAYPVTKWIEHPQFSTWTGDYDIGIMITEEPFDFGHFLISPIEVAAQRPAVGKYGTIAGWGYVQEFGPSSNQLQNAQVPIVSEADCLAAYGAGEVTQRMICAGLPQGGRDACQGDTGGPLVVDEKLVGLVSWGRGCARAGYPGVYTYVPSLKSWIDETVAANL